MENSNTLIAPKSVNWEEFIFKASYSLVASCFNKTIYEIFNDLDLKETTRQVMTELNNYARKNGVKNDTFVIDDLINKARTYIGFTKDYFKSKNTSIAINNQMFITSEKIGLAMPVTKKLYESTLTQN